MLYVLLPEEKVLSLTTAFTCRLGNHMPKMLKCKAKYSAKLMLLARMGDLGPQQASVHSHCFSKQCIFSTMLENDAVLREKVISVL